MLTIYIDSLQYYKIQNHMSRRNPYQRSERCRNTVFVYYHINLKFKGQIMGMFKDFNEMADKGRELRSQITKYNKWYHYVLFAVALIILVVGILAPGGYTRNLLDSLLEKRDAMVDPSFFITLKIVFLSTIYVVGNVVSIIIVGLGAFSFLMHIDFMGVKTNAMRESEQTKSIVIKKVISEINDELKKEEQNGNFQEENQDRK